MFKITYLPTGHTFLLPAEDAKELREKYPNEYRIIEKNGKKFKDKTKITVPDKTILAKVLEE